MLVGMCCCPVVGLLLTFALLQGERTSSPPLPDLALDRFPPASRDALGPELDRARRTPDDATAVGRLAMALQAWEQWEAAHTAFQRARHLATSREPSHANPHSPSAGSPGSPDAFPWAYLDGIVLLRMGRTEDAVAALTAALAIRPDDLPARVKLAEALFDSGQIEASARLNRELVKEPSAAAPIAELGLGRAAAAAGRHEEAIAHLTRAIALYPEFGAAHYALARSLRAVGRTEDAQRALAQHQRFGARWPAMADPLLAEVAAFRTDARALLQRGRKLAEAGDVEGAIAAHEEALSRDRSSGQAHAELIVLYGRAKNWEKAEAHYRAAVAGGTDLEEAHYNYGVLLTLQERWDEADAAYRRSLDINPLNPQARNNLGQMLERRGRIDEAAAEYRRTVEAAPGFRLARFNLGRMLIALGRPQDAIVELARLTEPRDAEAPRYLFALAVAHIRAGDRSEGVKWAAEARRLAQEHQQQDLAAAIDRELASLK
jgi:tetratricopeptide (TPR) repeat protein